MPSNMSHNSSKSIEAGSDKLKGKSYSGIPEAVFVVSAPHSS